MADASGTSSARRSSQAGSGNASRPLSYASVVTGTPTSSIATGTPSSSINTGTPASSLAQLARAGVPSQNTSAYSSNSFPLQYHQDIRIQEESGSAELDRSVRNGAVPHRRGLSVSSASRLEISGSPIQPFSIPPYLQNSRYARKLEAAHTARIRAMREVNQPDSSSVHGSIWQRPNTARIAPSHRGMTYDIIESNPPVEDEISLLPSRLSATDKYQGLDLFYDGLEVKYNGLTGKELEAASIRSDHPMPPQCGVFYYEITISQKHKDCVVAVGFSAGKVSLERLPGWEAESWGYHGDEGKVFSGSQNGQTYKSSFGMGDIIGCGVDFNKGHAFFTKNGLDLGVAVRDLDLSTPLFPCIGMKKNSGVAIKVNFGSAQFTYDINHRVNQEVETVRRQITKTKTSGLHPGHKTEASFTSELIAQFLSHGGYVDTAKEFLAQVHSQNEDLESSIPTLYNAETEDARSRQLIRHAILRGDIDTALDATAQYFPAVSSRFPHVIFQLKCRKFVELVSKAAEVSKAASADVKGKAQSNGDGGHFAATSSVFDQDMEVDDEHQTSLNGHAKAPFQSREPSSTDYDQLTSEAIRYGRALKAEYGDKDQEQSKILHDIFSLMPYYNPSASQNGHLLESSGRNKVAEELNAAILTSLGRAPNAALETICRQNEALLEILSQEGGPAAFVHPQSDEIR